MRVNLGRLLATPAVLETVAQGRIMEAVERHANGDWGDVCASDKGRNNWAAKNGARLQSAYHAKAKDDPEREVKFWIITEADRSATTVLLPSEY